MVWFSCRSLIATTVPEGVSRRSGPQWPFRPPPATALVRPPVLGDLDGNRCGLLRTDALRPPLVLLLAAVVGFAHVRIRGLFLLARQLDTQLLDEHHRRRRDGQGEKSSEDSHQRSAREEREHHDGRGKTHRPAVDPGNEHATLELPRTRASGRERRWSRRPSRRCREDRRPHREKSADVGQHVREACEDRQRQGVPARRTPSEGRT